MTDTSPKHPWLRRLALSVAVLCVVLAGTVAYLHTSHAFRHVIVPLVARLSHAHVTVRDGFLSLEGTVEIDGLQFRAPNKGISIDSERVYLSVSLLPILRRQPAIIRDFQLNGTTVALSEPTDQEEESARPSPAEPLSTSPIIPAVIEQVRVQDFTLSRLTRDSLVTVRGASMTADHLQPGQTGAIKVAMSFSHERGSTTVPVSGTFALNLSLEQNSTGTGLRWDGTDTIVVESGIPETDDQHKQAITFIQTLSGQYDVTTQNLHMASNIAAKRGEDALGETHAEARLEGDNDQQPLHVRLKIKGLSGEALTMLLLGLSPVQFASGRIDGEVEATRIGKLTGVRTALIGQQLTLRYRERTTPPIHLKIDQSGSFDEGMQALTLETLNVVVSNDTRRLVTASLENPTVVNFVPRSRDAAPAPEHKSDAEGRLKFVLYGLTVRDLRPWLALTGTDPLNTLTDGELRGTAELAVFNEGRALDLTSDLNFSKLMVRTERGAGILGPLAMRSETRAKLIDFKTLHVEKSTVLVSLRTKQVTQADFSGSIHIGQPPAIENLDGNVMLDGLPLEAAAPVLAMASPAKIHGGVVDGGGKVHLGGDRISWDLKFQGKDVSLKMPDMAGPTPPLELLLKQIGSFDRTTETLRLEDLAVQVIENGRPVVVGSLNKPLAVRLSQDTPRSGRSAESAPITLTLEVSQLRMNQLRPWMALGSPSFLSHARHGEMSGRFQVDVVGAADQIDLDGTLDLNDLQIERPGSHAVAEPITIRSRLRATVSERARIKLDSSSIRVLAGPRPLAEFSGTGLMDWTKETADLKVEMASDNLTATLDRLGFLTPKQRRLADGGILRSESTIVTSGPGQPLRIATTVKLDTVTVRLDAQHIQTHSLTGQWAVAVSGDRRDLHIEQANLTLLSDGKDSGAFTVAGHWPLGKVDRGSATKSDAKGLGELAITAKGWDANVPVSFLDVLPGRAPAPLPITLTMTMRQDATKPGMMLRGSGAVGPLHPARAGVAAESKMLQFEQDVTHHENDLHITSLTLSTQSTQKSRGDRLTLSGFVRLGPRPRVQARGKIETMDLKWFADLLTDPGEPEQADAAVAAAPVVPALTGKGFPADVDVDLEIGSVSYEGLRAEHGRLTARGSAGNLHTTLSPTRVASGTMEGTIDVTMIQSEPHVKWSVQGQNLPVESLILAFKPGTEPPFIGIAVFKTSGTGRGSGETLKQTLSGTANFDLRNGRFVKSELLAYIARQTLIDEFEHMGFDRLYGELQTKEGWVHLKRLHAQNPAIILDASGRVGLDGTMDVKVWPRVSAGLAKKAGRACFAPLLHTVDGFTVFPFAVMVRGTWNQREYGIELRAEDIVMKNARLITGGLLKTLEGCGSLPIKGGEMAVDAIKDAAKGLFKGMFKDSQ